jgi:hypothetical protein
MNLRPQPINWQPIETAPRDGSRFLVFEPFEPTVECAYFNEDGDLAPTSGRGRFWKQPTHWAPVPLPPFGNAPI